MTGEAGEISWWNELAVGLFDLLHPWGNRGGPLNLSKG